MKRLMNKHDEWKENDNDIHGIIVDYFSNLVKTLTDASGLKKGEKVYTITEEQNTKLGAPITSEELRTSVFSMHPEKLPSVDGLNPGFLNV